eukprot:TRINITY_DN14243_c0_g1_i1.p5 TRINITY_DN14243_c0_g1~~TRINITY_DN14243_c0_g1_i1.p5  ORF type:complete len:112 (-),score=11.77 TRINITY_DN14243_c0_g1_i1:62-397(-)
MFPMQCAIAADKRDSEQAYKNPQAMPAAVAKDPDAQLRPPPTCKTPNKAPTPITAVLLPPKVPTSPARNNTASVTAGRHAMATMSSLESGGSVRKTNSLDESLDVLKSAHT